MEWITALVGVVVGAACTHLLTLARDRRTERARDTALAFELRRKLDELRLHIMEPQNFDIGFFSGSGIDEFLAKSCTTCSVRLLSDLSSWRRAVTHYLWYSHRKGASSPERQQQLVDQLERILAKYEGVPNQGVEATR